MRPIDFADLRRQLDVLRVLELLHWRAVRTEAGWRRGGCPLHQRNHMHGDCFAAMPTGYHCHSCKRHGDGLRLYAEYFGLQVQDAARELVTRLNLSVACLPRRPRRPRQRRDREEAR